MDMNTFPLREAKKQKKVLEKKHQCYGSFFIRHSDKLNILVKNVYMHAADSQARVFV